MDTSKNIKNIGKKRRSTEKIRTKRRLRWDIHKDKQERVKREINWLIDKFREKSLIPCQEWGWDSRAWKKKKEQETTGIKKEGVGCSNCLPVLKEIESILFEKELSSSNIQK